MWSGGGVPPMCRAPFTSMEFNPDGSVLICCANYLYPIGFVGTHGLKEMWSGPAVQRLRSAVEQGDMSLGCTICSHRIRHHGAELPLRAYEQLDTTDDGEWPTALSFSLHNTCNLECVMCGADRSSKIRTRRLGLPPLPHRYGDEFFDELPEFIARAQWCDFVGGEPLLIREHWRVWDIMREVAPGVACAITTNGTVWNARVEALLEDFPTAVRISMDGVTAGTFESIRVGADFEEFHANFRRFHNYAEDRGTDLTIAWSFTRQNWFELGEAMLWAEGLGIPLYVTTVLERDFGVQHLPTPELAAVHERMLAQSDLLRPQLTINLDAWDRQLDMVATELDDRAELGPLRVAEACMEAPSPDAAVLAARSITSHELPSRRDERSGAPRDLAGYVSDWGLRLDGADRLICDRSGAVLAHQRGWSDLLEGLVPGSHSLVDVFELLCDRVGGQLWRLEELQLCDAFVVSVGVGGAERDGNDVAVFRLLVTHTDAGHEVTVVPSKRTGHLEVPLTIRRPERRRTLVRWRERRRAAVREG